MKGVYIVGGYPDRDTFKECVKAVAESGFDFIEIGIPFNDPIADGPVIVQAINDAVSKGITAEMILEDIAFLKDYDIKIYIMTYANIVYSHGISKFSDSINGLVSGLIIPDLPNRLHSYFYDHGLKQSIIPFATLESGDEDLVDINTLKGDFVYFIGVRGITGSKSNMKSEELINKINSVKKRADKKIILGFGIKDRDDVAEALAISDGFVIGTEAVRRQNDIATFRSYISKLIE